MVVDLNRQSLKVVNTTIFLKKMVQHQQTTPEEYKEAIAFMAMKAKQHNHQGDVLELPQYIYAQLNDYATTKREEIFSEVMDTIHLTVLRSIRATCKYYDTQITTS